MRTRIVTVVGWAVLMFLCHAAEASITISWNAENPDYAVDNFSLLEPLVFDSVIAVGATELVPFAFVSTEAMSDLSPEPVILATVAPVHLTVAGTSEAVPESSGLGSIFTMVNAPIQPSGGIDNFSLGDPGWPFSSLLPTVDAFGNPQFPERTPPEFVTASAFGSGYSVVPEPGTFALMGIGLATLLLKNRRGLSEGLRNWR